MIKELSSVVLRTMEAAMIKSKNLLYNLGIYLYFVGHHCLLYGISLIQQDSTYLFSITTRLYPAIAEHSGKGKTAVKSGICNSIERFWLFGNRKLFYQMIGYERKEPPSNREFFAILVDFLNKENG